jgi:hypothetical protein
MTYPYRRSTKQERELRRNYESLRTKRKFQRKHFFLNAVTILGIGMAALAITALFYLLAVSLLLLA